jgi:hypothetical protein
VGRRRDRLGRGGHLLDGRREVGHLRVDVFEHLSLLVGPARNLLDRPAHSFARLPDLSRAGACFLTGGGDLGGDVLDTLHRRLHLVHHLVEPLGDQRHRLALARLVHPDAEVAGGGAFHRGAVLVGPGFEVVVQSLDVLLY